MLKSYLKNITDISNRGDAREESFYIALSELLDKYAESTSRKNIHVTTLPKKLKPATLILEFGMGILNK
jgi:hypothetical protein